jgi:GNAT superfamily N-acetyltransferase
MSVGGVKATSGLDEPIWNALTTVHAYLAEGGALARRYPAAIGPAAAVREHSDEAYLELAPLLRGVGAGYGVMFLVETPPLPHGWHLHQDFPMEQMVFESSVAPRGARLEGLSIEKLNERDVPEMVALATLTEPGPFGTRTIEYGGYVGIRQAGRLVAMSGQRLAPAGFREVSAVCTHPDFRGRGYAAALVTRVVEGILPRGEVPFLGVKQDNVGAIRVYERLGFRVRRTLRVAVVIPPGSGSDTPVHL